jgi:EpsI family protein
MIGRVFIAAAVLAVGGGGVNWVSRAETRVPRQSFAAFPLEIGTWKGRDNPPFETKVLKVLGVDDHVNRTYLAESLPVSLYIGYYDSQRTGDTIHSPMKCLPGTGWQPLSTGVVTMTVPNRDRSTREARINRYVVQKSSDRYVVYFWYQTHGRVIASEYVAKLRLMLDAIRINRTDGALVRVIVPVGDHGSEADADLVASRFLHDLFPALEPYLPL